MINLLTGKPVDPSHPIDPTADHDLVEQPFTAEAYLAAMRRNLYAASRPGADTATLLLAANTLALAAQAAKTAPTKQPARTMAPYGDTI